MSRQGGCGRFHAGALPVSAGQLATGMILVGEPPAGGAGVAFYARVSWGDQRADLDRQVVVDELRRRHQPRARQDRHHHPPTGGPEPVLVGNDR
ncbi:hypothetical protein K6U06_11155 [Acidiferrimicrobium sp. IK]|uniref:hypothetical protein n=1 Tax=Acidiferrimicrobium sp. IK TaxID=2871700 RepID=UPI0021CB62EC|nr:hypothetical protein [Acidiferrimicrobium sp. IK]MCU4184919.1 hypothetical protein [Acidiferrimicrobium sp. IK]